MSKLKIDTKYLTKYVSESQFFHLSVHEKSKAGKVSDRICTISVSGQDQFAAIERAKHLTGDPSLVFFLAPDEAVSPFQDALAGYQA